jgi:nicotinate phosphoribosyltransferase
MGSAAPPPILPTSALGIELGAFAAIRAAEHAGIADRRATFELTFEGDDRDGFLLFAGLEALVDALERLRLKPDELAWLHAAAAIDDGLRRRLSEMRFVCDVDSALDGSVVFGGEPVVVVEGPYWQTQLVGGIVKSALVDTTHAASYVARCALAADGVPLLETTSADARRLGGAPLLARAAYVAGASATTSALAGKRYGIPVRAIAPHHLFDAIGDDAAALEAWLASTPEGAIVRLDGHDPHASLATLGRLISQRAKRASWDDVRLSVLLPPNEAVELAHEAAGVFEAAGLREPHVFVGGPLGPAAIAELRRQASHFAGFCVSPLEFGESTARASYSLVAIEKDGAWSPRAPSLPRRDERGDPGRKLVVRYLDSSQRPVADVIHLANERMVRAKDGRFFDRASGAAEQLAGATSSAPLLSSVMRAGKRANAAESARSIRQRATKALAALQPRHRRLATPARYPVGITSALAVLKAELTRRA